MVQVVADVEFVPFREKRLPLCVRTIVFHPVGKKMVKRKCKQLTSSQHNETRRNARKKEEYVLFSSARHCVRLRFGFLFVSGSLFYCIIIVILVQAKRLLQGIGDYHLNYVSTFCAKAHSLRIRFSQCLFTCVRSPNTCAHDDDDTSMLAYLFFYDYGARYHLYMHWPWL